MARSKMTETRNIRRRNNPCCKIPNSVSAMISHGGFVCRRCGFRSPPVRPIFELLMFHYSFFPHISLRSAHSTPVFTAGRPFFFPLLVLRDGCIVDIHSSLSRAMRRPAERDSPTHLPPPPISAATAPQPLPTATAATKAPAAHRAPRPRRPARARTRWRKRRSRRGRRPQSVETASPPRRGGSPPLLREATTRSCRAGRARLSATAALAQVWRVQQRPKKLPVLRWMLLLLSVLIRVLLVVLVRVPRAVRVLVAV